MRAFGRGAGLCNLMRAAALVVAALATTGLSPAVAQESGTQIPVRLDHCPPEQSLISFLTGQAFEEGRKAESREHGKLLAELYRISTSDFDDEGILERSFAVMRVFVQSMQARGHEIDFGDVLVHRETSLNSSLYHNSVQSAPIRRAQLELQLAVARKMKRRICPQ